jgi:hypothetical protein
MRLNIAPLSAASGPTTHHHLLAELDWLAADVALFASEQAREAAGALGSVLVGVTTVAGVVAILAWLVAVAVNAAWLVLALAGR